MVRTAFALAAALAASLAVAQKSPGGPSSMPPPQSPARDPLAPSPPRMPPEPPPQAPRPLTKPVDPATVLNEVSGTVKQFDRAAHKLAVDTGNGAVTLSVDRNTMVYTANGLGTVLDVSPGAQIRAGSNADHLAYWVQVRTPPTKTEPASTPGQGTGPAGGGAAPASESTGKGAGPAPAPPSTSPTGAPPSGGVAP